MKGRVGLVDACRPSCTRVRGLPEHRLVTPAVRNFDILPLPSAVDVQGRLELSNCCFQTTGQHPPHHLLVFS